MQDYISFLMDHWSLGLSILLILVLIVMEELKGKQGGGFAVSPQDAVNLINREKGVVVDLRAAEHFAAGHIVDAINIPLANWEKELKSLNKYRERPIIFIYPTNKSATVFLMKARQSGLAKLQLLAGGVEAWKNADLPLTQKRGIHAS